MNIQVTDSLASLRAQLVQAQEKLAIAQKAVKAAERAEERASNLVEDIREAIAMSQLQSWREHPDLAELMNSGEGSTMVFYRALGEVGGRGGGAGGGRGGLWGGGGGGGGGGGVAVWGRGRDPPPPPPPPPPPTS